MKLRNFEKLKNIRYDGYQRASTIVVFKFFHKKTGSAASVNEQLAEELHKPTTKTIKRRNVYARLKDNISATDLAGMESLFSKNKKVKYLLCVMGIFTKYPWVKPLKDKKLNTVFNAFMEIKNGSNHKPNKL